MMWIWIRLPGNIDPALLLASLRPPSLCRSYPPNLPGSLTNGQVQWIDRSRSFESCISLVESFFRSIQTLTITIIPYSLSKQVSRKKAQIDLVSILNLLSYLKKFLDKIWPQVIGIRLNRVAQALPPIQIHLAWK